MALQGLGRVFILISRSYSDCLRIIYYLQLLQITDLMSIAISNVKYQELIDCKMDHLDCVGHATHNHNSKKDGSKHFVQFYSSAINQIHISPRALGHVHLLPK